MISKHKTTGLFLLAVAMLGGANPVLAAESDQSTIKPYTIENGKVDKATYNGWRRYTESCMRCHGPDGLGSSYAPNLTDSLHTLSKQQFEETVINGKKEVNTASDRVMPSFGLNPDVAEKVRARLTSRI